MITRTCTSRPGPLATLVAAALVLAAGAGCRMAELEDVARRELVALEMAATGADSAARPERPLLPLSLPFNSGSDELRARVARYLPDLLRLRGVAGGGRWCEVLEYCAAVGIDAAPAILEMARDPASPWVLDRDTGRLLREWQQYAPGFARRPHYRRDLSLALVALIERDPERFPDLVGFVDLSPDAPWWPRLARQAGVSPPALLASCSEQEVDLATVLKMVLEDEDSAAYRRDRLFEILDGVRDVDPTLPWRPEVQAWLGPFLVDYIRERPGRWRTHAFYIRDDREKERARRSAVEAWLARGELEEASQFALELEKPVGRETALVLGRHRLSWREVNGRFIVPTKQDVEIAVRFLRLADPTLVAVPPDVWVDVYGVLWQASIGRVPTFVRYAVDVGLRGEGVPADELLLYLGGRTIEPVLDLLCRAGIHPGKPAMVKHCTQILRDGFALEEVEAYIAHGGAYTDFDPKVFAVYASRLADVRARTARDVRNVVRALATARKLGLAPPPGVLIALSRDVHVVAGPRAVDLEDVVDLHALYGEPIGASLLQRRFAAARAAPPFTRLIESTKLLALGWRDHDVLFPGGAAYEERALAGLSTEGRERLLEALAESPLAHRFLRFVGDFALESGLRPLAVDAYTLAREHTLAGRAAGR